MTLPTYKAMATALAPAENTLELTVAHPGLLLDRYAVYQSPTCAEFKMDKGQAPHIDRVIAANKTVKAESLAKNSVAQAILDQWDGMTTAMPFQVLRWKQTTLWRLAAHLSRAGTLENGAICQHPIYGFPYLPGSGLKGMAFTQARLLLRYPDDDSPGEDPKQDRDILRIFGNAVKRRKNIDGTEDKADDIHDRAGSVNFLEAWPSTWPALDKDIVNSHHRDYYANKGANDHPPGDWESPVPTYFLAVAANTSFRFAVAKRDLATPDTDLEKAKSWLQLALQELGAGAKTAAGYGYFSGPQPLQ